MEASYLAGASHSSRDNAVLQPKSTNVGKCFLFAIAIITVVSIVATGCLYEQIGNWSFGIGGGGLIVALVLTAIGLCYNSKTSSQPHIEEKRHSNISQTSSFSEEIIEKKSPNPQSIQQLQVPVRAADIKLSETVPKDIPPQCDISGREWLLNTHLHKYITYLATKSSGIFVPDIAQMAYRSWDESLDGLHDYIFNYLPSQFNNLNILNLPIYLYVSGNHWTLVYIDRERRTVEYYDSKKNYGKHSEIVQKLSAITEELSRQEPHQPPYKFVRKINKVLQPDSCECGPWILYFLENRLINPDFDFNQLDIDEAQELIKRYRLKVMLKLIEMDRASTVIDKQEMENYAQHYKEETLARKMLWKDLKKIPYIDRWKQILNGQPLIPSQAL